MKRSHSSAELSSDKEESLDAAGETIKQAQSLEFKQESVWVWGNNEEGSIQGASGVGNQSTQASLGLESCNFQDVLRDAVQANRTEAGLGLESHNFQGQPNVEESAIQDAGDVAIQLTQTGSRPESLNAEEQPNVEEGCTHPFLGPAVQSIQAGLGLECQNFQEQPNTEERGKVGLEPTHVVFPSLLIQGNYTLQTRTDEQRCLIAQLAHSISCNTNTPRGVLAGTPHPEEETGSNDGSMPQTPVPEMGDLGDDHLETSCQEIEQKEFGTHNRIGLQASIIDHMECLTSAGWIELVDSLKAMDAEEEILIQARAGEQEMPDLDEPTDDEADIGIQVRASQKCNVNPDEVLDSMQALTGEKLRAQIEKFLQSVSCYVNNPRIVQAGASHKETGSSDGNNAKTSLSDMKDLRNSQDEMSHQEGAGLDDRIGPQASRADLNKSMDDEKDVPVQAQAGWQQVQGFDELMDEEESGIQVQAGQQQMQDGPSQQGTAGRRMRLQVPICGAEGPIEQTVFRLPQVRKLACLVKCI